MRWVNFGMVTVRVTAIPDIATSHPYSVTGRSPESLGVVLSIPFNLHQSLTFDRATFIARVITQEAVVVFTICDAVQVICFPIKLDEEIEIMPVVINEQIQTRQLSESNVAVYALRGQTRSAQTTGVAVVRKHSI